MVIMEYPIVPMALKSQGGEAKRIARERIVRLFSQAEKESDQYPARSNRYVELARAISMKQRVRIPRELRRRFCRHCSAFLVPGRTSRVRVHGGKVVVTCLVCGSVRRYPVVRQHNE